MCSFGLAQPRQTRTLLRFTGPTDRFRSFGAFSEHPNISLKRKELVLIICLREAGVKWARIVTAKQRVKEMNRVSI